MRCIFCKQNSSSSKSIEHIVPESLGNIEHVLPPGIVCDKCNNYFACNVEKTLLDSDYFVYGRFENLIPSKKGKIPPVKGFHPESSSICEINANRDKVSIFLDKDIACRFTSFLQAKKGGCFYIPYPTKIENQYVLSRFIGKVALESLASKSLLASKALDNPSVIDVDIIDNKGLDALRNHVRHGNSNKKIWPIHVREIYPADNLFPSDKDGEYYDIPHEFSLWYTERKELFFIIVIFGVEYAIDMANPSIDAYLKWLEKNDHKSPLYMDEDINFALRRGIYGLQEGSTIDVYQNP